jgi:cephalosporin-C deacetylase
MTFKRGAVDLLRAIPAVSRPYVVSAVCAVLAVFGGTPPGGSSGTAVAEVPEAIAAPPALSAAPDRATGIYHVGDRVGWTLTLAPGQEAQGWHFAIRSNGLAVLSEGALSFAGGHARLEVPAGEPGMLLAVLNPPSPADKPVTLGAAVDPQALRPSVDRPGDFRRFWRAKLQQLAAVPAHPVLSPGPSGEPGVDYATIVMDSVGGAHIHGQLARPAGGARLPGLVIFQWAGGPYPLQKEWVTGRAAQGWLVLNIEPHDVLPDQPPSYYEALPAALKSYHTIGLTDRDRSYFLAMYLADQRAIEYLAGRADWDGRTLVVMGTSMGGQQSLCAAGLSPRVTAVIVNEPSGADASGPLHGRLAGYPNWPADNPRALATAQYFDTVSCAPGIRVPALISMGFTDTVAPPAGIWTAFNLVRGPKEAVPMVDSPHNNFATAEQQRPYTQRAEEWLTALRTTGRPPPPVR